MRRIKDILLLSLLATCAVGCIDDSEPALPTPEQEMAYINLYITTGSNSPSAMTRVAAESGENQINTIKVWAFGNVTLDNGTTSRQLFGYVGKDFSHNPTGATDLETFFQKLELAIPKVYVEQGGTADFYFLANAESIGLGGLNDVTTEDELKAKVMPATYSLSSASYTNGSGTNALPISRIVTDVPIKSLMSDQQPLRVVMQRAVSRVRFYVAQEEGIENFSMKDITIGDGNTDLLLSNQSIFPATVAWSSVSADDETVASALNKWKAVDGTTVITANGATATYSADKITATLPTTPSIASIKELESTYDMQTDKSAWITGNATLMNVTYLRETDKTALPLSFTYTKDTEENELTKIETLTLGSTDLLRNHDIIVFAYLTQGNKLVLQIHVQEWTDVNITINYAEEISWRNNITWNANTINGTGTETISGTEYTIVYVKPGANPLFSFALATPEGWNWVAELVTLEGTEGYFTFSNDETTYSGKVGTGANLTIKYPDGGVTETQRARLRIYVRTELGDQAKEAQVNYIISRGI